MEPAIERVSDTVYNAVGFDVANSTFVVGDGGIVVIDAMTGVENLTAALTAFREICDYPVKGVVYSHSHGDHLGRPALRSFMADGDELPVIAQRRLVAEVGRINGYNQPIVPHAARPSSARTCRPAPRAWSTSAQGPSSRSARPRGWSRPTSCRCACGRSSPGTSSRRWPSRSQGRCQALSPSPCATVLEITASDKEDADCWLAFADKGAFVDYLLGSGLESLESDGRLTISGARGIAESFAGYFDDARTQAGSPSRCTAGRNGQAEQSDEGESPWCPGDPETYGFPGGDL